MLLKGLPKSRELAYAYALMGALRVYRSEALQARSELRKSLRIAKATFAYQAESLAYAVLASVQRSSEKKRAFHYLERSLEDLPRGKR